MLQRIAIKRGLVRGISETHCIEVVLALLTANYTATMTTYIAFLYEMLFILLSSVCCVLTCCCHISHLGCHSMQALLVTPTLLPCFAPVNVCCER
jgi:hypothetical protein